MSEFTRSRGCGAPLFTTAATAAAAEPCRAAQPVTCCTSLPTVPPKPDTDACGCCKASMRQALKLMCCNQISDLLDFNGFAFITDDLLVGAQPATMSPASKDNLTALDGTFRRFSPCNCDLIDIAGTAYGPFGSLVDVNQATLCSLSALAFQVDQTTAAAPNASAGTTVCQCCTIPSTPAERYIRVRDLLQCQLAGIDDNCGECVCHCDCTDDCCCADGVLAALSSMSLNKRATLVAGLLALQDVSVIGTIGNVLVLGNDTNYRFYFVCANKVEMLA